MYREASATDFGSVVDVPSAWSYASLDGPASPPRSKTLCNKQEFHHEWSSNEIELYFAFHGEPAGDTTGYFESYTVGTAASIRGTFTALFEGSHGWYWENKTQLPIVVELNTQGTYDVIGIK